MVNPEQLRARGLRAYEGGRLRMALRIAVVVIPAAAVCLIEPKARETCACLTVLLLGTAVWLRWRDRRGMEDVTTGLLAGSIPLVAGLVLGRFYPDCAAAGGLWICRAFAALVSLSAGVLIGVRETRQRARLWSWFRTGTIAALVASLGCARLGLTEVAIVALGIALGTVGTALIAKPAA